MDMVHMRFPICRREGLLKAEGHVVFSGQAQQAGP